MTENNPVVDLVARAPNSRQTVEQRIERRLTVLREWLREGIPSGKRIPTTLNDARSWNDPDLGIAPISSPNEFTQTHPFLGERVRDIAGLLTALRRRFDPPKKKHSVQSNRSETATSFDRKAHDRQLQAAVSQWHAERDRALASATRADAADARSIALLQENAGKDDLIADLRRQLIRREGLRAVE